MESVWKDGFGQKGRAACTLQLQLFSLVVDYCTLSVQIIAEEKANEDIGSLSVKFKIHEETEV